ncbi:hypothetical protein SEA_LORDFARQUAAD_70 [Gordonia phage LordFarquaad]|uniref:Uncharacterized protein n=3 Tax=Attisvirus attis TaxID=2169707 RepID=A0A142K8V9_9CAUD|nr:hypothetical protein SEA_SOILASSASSIN_67 [Gordonia phage SoilAssassin]YP_009595825.1 hypothetical protein FDH00_gp67 [Gordonia phage Attis]AMS02468.1 hypothetical protein SEA_SOILASSASSIN_67 [Gordonia phage SoilAssassin]AMS02542.1 hypothetical protein SEA_ATTIS_67 [Gordonia phage Attis]QDF18390.1 hypothetical protein SEA_LORDFARQUAAD_70 [Gordonia phage LordFarquaad]
MTNHDDVLDRIDAVIREAEIDELVDWQLARGEHGDRPAVSGADLLWDEWVFAHEWINDQLREVALAIAWAANRLAQRLRKRARL